MCLYFSNWDTQVFFFLSTVSTVYGNCHYVGTLPPKYTTEVIKPNMLCAESAQKNQGKGVCFGDSGGPLTVKEKGRHVLVGVSSWIYQCNSVSLIFKIWQEVTMFVHLSLVFPLVFP